MKELISSFYSALPLGIFVAFLYMFFYMECKRDGVKQTVKKAIELFRTDRRYRGVFFIGFYTVLVLFRTIFGRDFRLWNLKYFLAGWGFCEDGKEAREAFSNVFLLAPFAFLVLYYFDDMVLKVRGRLSAIVYGLRVCFFLSLGIECFQFVFGFGSIQVADIVYNTLGGAIGALLYLIVKRVFKH